jgi:uncharacterized membrane protein
VLIAVMMVVVMIMIVAMMLMVIEHQRKKQSRLSGVQQLPALELPFLLLKINPGLRTINRS